MECHILNEKSLWELLIMFVAKQINVQSYDYMF